MIRLFLRGFILVSLVSMNTVQIAHGRYVSAFVVGGLISLVWFYNARTASQSDVRCGGCLYAFGAACGTVIGMWAGR